MDEKKVDTGSDGYVSIEISENRMEAFGSFFPSIGEGRPLEKVQAESALKVNNITHGIDWDPILESIDKCNDEQKAIEHISIAKGTISVKSSPEHINLKPDFFDKTKTVIRKDGSVDYKASSPFVLVKKGEAIGRLFSYRPGIPGIDVTGEKIPFKSKDIQIFKTGENLELKDSILISMVFGRFIIDGDLISITEVLEIGTDVDYHTGNVSFSGDIVINGVIHDGFRVAAGGSIRCKKIIKNAEVFSRGNLDLDLGLKGRGQAVVRINGLIRAKFLEDGTIESRTGLEISTSILSCRINTLGKLIMGQKGTIVTSQIVAEKGIEVFNLSRENCAPSTVICGISFVENRKLDHLKTRHEILLEKSNKLKMSNKSVQDLIKQIENTLESQKREIEKLGNEVNTFEEAKVIVHGTLFAGTEIIIGKYKRKIEKNETRVIICLNKEKQQLEIRPLV